MQNKLTDPATLTFEPQNSTTPTVSRDDSPYQVLTLWDHSFLSYTADRETDKQTDSKMLPMPTDIVGVGNYRYFYFLHTYYCDFLKKCVQMGKFVLR